MIDLNITADQAIALLMLIEHETKMYTTGPACPARVTRLRELNTIIDGKLEEHFAEQENAAQDHFAEQAESDV